MRRGTNGPRVGNYNRTVVLDAIRESDGISRVELSTRTGLTQQTMSNIVRRLIAEHLVVESGRIQGGMGKPRTVLRVNDRAHHAVGVHIDPKAITCVVVDLSGKVMARVISRLPLHSRPATVVNQIVRGVELAVKRSDVERDSLLGVGIAAPGTINHAGGELIGPPNLPGWKRVLLRDAVAERVGLPVLLDNDTTAAAVGERWAGGFARGGSFAFIYLGTGIGCGLVLTDQVYRGESGNAGEFGHLSIDANGRPCHCGNRGCLEAYISPAALNAELRACDHGLSAASGVDLGWADLASAIDAGDDVVLAVVIKAAERLGDAAVGLVNLFDIKRLVIGGRGINGLMGLFRAAVTERTNTRSIARGTRTVSVEASIVGEDVAAIGAASLVLHGSYAPHLSVLLADVP
jgi:predicted NBD/HSP70 family sugar kinase